MDFNAQRLDIDLQLRSLSEQVKAGTVKAEDARKQFDELRAKKDEISKAEALAAAPIEKRSNIVSFADIRDSMLEKRAITVNGTGVINQITQIVELIAKKTPLLQAIQYFYGPNASTNIPLLSPGLALPATASEGYTSGSTDTDAVLSSTSVTPVAYISTLPVSWEALNLSAANLESQFPQLFAKVFAQAMHKVIADALFTSATGVATANQIECAAAGLPVIMDVVGLTDEMGDYDIASTALVMSIQAKQNILANVDETKAAQRIYAEELIRNKSINGVPVIVTSFAPHSVTTGALTVVGGDLSNFGMGVASSLMITPKQKVGDGNTYFDAAMYFGGKVIQPKNLFALKAKASG